MLLLTLFCLKSNSSFSKSQQTHYCTITFWPWTSCDLIQLCAQKGLLRSKPEEGQVWFLSCSGCWARSHGCFCSRFLCWGGNLSGSWAVGYGHSVHSTTQLELKCLCGIKIPGENLVFESLSKLPHLAFAGQRMGFDLRGFWEWLCPFPWRVPGSLICHDHPHLHLPAHSGVVQGVHPFLGWLCALALPCPQNSTVTLMPSCLATSMFEGSEVYRQQRCF